MNRILLFLSPLFLFLAFSCGQPPADQAAQSITAESLKSHIEVLSSDEFKGRAPATPGEDRTVDYLIEAMEEIGVEPGMDDETYVQEIPLLGQQVDGSSANMNLRQN